MRADFHVVLDACVLANQSLCDLLLRLAETPRLYSPLWSDEILDEVKRTHEKLTWPKDLTDSWDQKVRAHFPESIISGYEVFIEQCENDLKDRHVLACAIKSKAELIVTFNLKDFPEEALSKWDIQAKHPQDYLLTLYSMEQMLVVRRLQNIADSRDRPFQDILIHLGRSVPLFSQKILEDFEF